MEDPRFELGEFEREIREREDEIGDLKNAAARSKLDFAYDLAALIYGVDRQAMQSTNRVCRRLTEARQVAMYLAHVALAVGYPEIALYANRNRATIRHGIERVEDRRDHLPLMA